MGAYIVRRLLSVIPVMAVVAIFVFLLLHLAPGDPARSSRAITPRRYRWRRSARKAWLERTLWKQFAVWVGSMLRGDLGRSLYWGVPVLTLIGQRAEPTISLALTTLFVRGVPCCFVGVLAAARVGDVD